MIVKNEKQNLSRCLASVKPYVDEMIVVDTGSQDGTPEIAFQYGATVKTFSWCDDFAAARNYAISQASGKWILMLDADEEFVLTSPNKLTELLTSGEEIAYLLSYREINDYLARTPIFRISLFRNIPELRYVSKIHEQLTYKNKYFNASELTVLENIEIVHYGHQKEQVKQKNRCRNIPILERMRQEESLNLRLLYCLAGMYAEIQDIEKSQECYTEAFQRLMPNFITGTCPGIEDFELCLFYDLGMKSFEQKDYETTRVICQRSIEWCPGYPPFYYLTGVLIKALGFPLGATAYFEKCIQLGKTNSYYKFAPFDLVFITTHPAYNLGCIYIELEQPQEALAAFQLVLSFDPNFMDAQQKADMIRQYLATQA